MSNLVVRPHARENAEFVHGFDERLSELWTVARKFCLLANLGTQTGMLVPPATIYGTMTAVMYRLLRMDFAQCSLNETVRLGLLAFTYHIFLQWQDVRLPHHHFSETYRHHLLCADLEKIVPSRVLLWLLMTGVISLFRISEEPWLARLLLKHFEECRVSKWEELQDILKSSMWIPLLDEKQGKQSYELVAGPCALIPSKPAAAI